jgi:hypothetical protein
MEWNGIESTEMEWSPSIGRRTTSATVPVNSDIGPFVKTVSIARFRSGQRPFHSPKDALMRLFSVSHIDWLFSFSFFLLLRIDIVWSHH